MQKRWIKSRRGNNLTWAVSNLDKVDATATTHEWLAQQLAAAAANIGVEGLLH